ncbi:MAG: hypothetical protein A2277_21085 [Desulfobacterales bacterium RIFOXYA12_FULL_46_15]|nr:MAG: hypothetical protein A2277_21085 [Desulfobacterales bacterium RIFOXYA12_FULL_46_15]
MKEWIKKNITGKKVFAVIMGSVLVIFLSFLLIINYKSQVRLQETALVRLVHFLDTQANAAGYFYLERKTDLKNISKAREISIFFENKALGMSMAYGLKTSLIQIDRLFDSLIEERKIGKFNIYERIVFVDTENNLISDRRAEPGIHAGSLPWKDFFASNRPEPEVIALRQDGHFDILVKVPFFFKWEFKGQIFAWINLEAFFDLQMKKGEGMTQKHIFIDFGLADGASFYPEPEQLPVDRIRKAGPGEVFEFVLSEPESGATGYLAVRIPVPETSFSIVTVMPVSEAAGYSNPNHLLMAMIILAAFVTGAAFLLWTMNARELVLKTRLDEENIRKTEIERKNIELAHYRENLELLVKERTKELEQAQKELLHKAVEAGRAQFSAMILHNIGNAITPVSVNTEMLRKNGGDKILQLLFQAYDDLAGHRNDLTYYVTTDPRGMEVAAYMGSLIKSLDGHRKKTDAMVQAISAGIDYVAEILSLQRAYAPDRAEMKERVDLNRVVEDALKIQENSILKRNICLEKIFASGLPHILIEKNKLMQVIINLIKNSFDAIDGVDERRENKIKVLTYVMENRVGLKISDTGIGIEKDKLKEIFEFGVSTKGSSGFGLYYCKDFVAANNGTLELESPGPGKGAAAVMEFLL